MYADILEELFKHKNGKLYENIMQLLQKSISTNETPEGLETVTPEYNTHNGRNTR